MLKIFKAGNHDKRIQKYVMFLFQRIIMKNNKCELDGSDTILVVFPVHSQI